MSSTRKMALCYGHVLVLLGHGHETAVCAQVARGPACQAKGRRRTPGRDHQGSSHHRREGRLPGGGRRYRYEPFDVATPCRDQGERLSGWPIVAPWVKFCTADRHRETPARIELAIAQDANQVRYHSATGPYMSVSRPRLSDDSWQKALRRGDVPFSGATEPGRT
jgi:hypothetical protein